MQAAIFDLDGTLVHSAPGLWHAVNRFLAQDGHAPMPLEQITGYIGLGLPNFVRCVTKDRMPDLDERGLALAIERFSAIYEQDPLRDCRLYDGIPETLAALSAAGWRIGLCTNKPDAAARDILAKTGIAAQFHAITGGDTLPQRKPEPEPLLHTIRALGVSPQDVVYIGDSAVDALTAQRAGIRFAFFTGGYSQGQPITADLRFDRFGESLGTAFKDLIAI